jgi:hypothetical protein
MKQTFAWMGKSGMVTLVAAAAWMAPAGEAAAACVSRDAGPRVSVSAPKEFVQTGKLAAGPGAAVNGSIESHGSIVGFWSVTFLLGSGPDVYDQGFQQWHSDNTELMVDNAVPPSFGNVCVGVWKRVGARTYRLKHMTFNWDDQGLPAGTFVLRMAVTLDRRGNVYEGTYVADSFDLSGALIPELHAEGNVTGQRITVN